MSEDDGASLVAPTTAGDLKKNAHALLNGRPCKIMDISKSKTGKHGHAKCNITGIDVVNGKKIVDVQPAHAAMYSADVKKTEYQLIGLTVDDDAKNGVLGKADLLDSNNNPYEVVVLDGEVGQKLVEEYDAEAETDTIVTVMTAPVQEGDKFTKVEFIVAFKSDK